MNNSISNKISNSDKILKTSTYITVSGVSLIILVKIMGWFMTSSVIILASLVDSLLDVCVSTMNLLAVHYSLRPADNKHRFGHGKIEDLAVFSQAVFFGLSGIGLIMAAIQRFYNPHDSVVETSSISMWIMSFSIVVTVVIISFQYYALSKSKSNVIKADSMHYFSDFLTNIMALIGIFVTSHWKIPSIDSVTAIGIAVYIIYNAYKLLITSFNNLLDQELDEEQRQIIIEILNSHKEVISFHDLKTRRVGAKPFIQFHIVLDSEMKLKKSHNIVTDLEEQVMKKIPDAEIIIHQDPEGVEEEVSYVD